MSKEETNNKNLLKAYYLEKLEALIRGELTVTCANENLLTVESGTLDMNSFLDCYINTRKEIKYEFISRVMDMKAEKCSKLEIIKLLRA